MSTNYEYVNLHMADGNTAQYKPEEVEDITIGFERLLTIKLTNNRVTVYKEWDSIDYKYKPLN